MDNFAKAHLPSPEHLPEFLFELPELQYPATLNATTYFLERNIERGNGEKRAILAPDGAVWTYRDVLEQSNRIAHVLVDDFGIKPGARVLLRAPNTPMLAACWFAVLKAGAIAVTTMPLYRAAELRHMIEKARIELALCDERLLVELHDACKGMDSLNFAVFQSDSPGAVEARMAKKPTSFANVETAAEDIALIAFTSGTTGSPKAAMHYHRDILAICDTYAKHVLQAQPDDIFTGSPPLAFTFGLGGILLFPFYVGATTLLLEKASPDELLRNIVKHKVTTLFTAPVAYRTLATLVQPGDTESLRRCVSAGETLPKPVFDAWFERTGIPLLDGIGSTEMLHIFVGSSLSNARAGCTGKVVPGYRAEIHDDEGNPLPVGEIGRLAVKGPTGCKYLDDARQKSYVQNGWNYPGDAYRQDAAGYFSYVARTDDMIVSSGYNISGPEVEQALLSHASVKEVAVVAKPDADRGTHIVKAYVVLLDITEACEERAVLLQEHCKRLIAPFKAPREIEFVHELPRTETGKVQRYKLRNRASTE